MIGIRKYRKNPQKLLNNPKIVIIYSDNNEIITVTITNNVPTYMNQPVPDFFMNSSSIKRAGCSAIGYTNSN